MGYAELIERVQSLPRGKQVEVFDFVEFLAVQSGLAGNKTLAHGEWTEGEFSVLAMQQALRGMEADPVVYTSNDLRERWQ